MLRSLDLKKTSEPIGQNSRWLEQIEEYDFNIIHRPGLQHGNADALSRRPCRQCGQDPGEHDAMIDAVHAVTDSSQFLNRVYHSSPQPVQIDDWTVEEIQKKQETDKEISPVYRWKKSLHNLEICTQWDQLTLINQILYRIQKRLIKYLLEDSFVPIELRNDAMFLAHTGMTNGHLAAERT